MNACVFCLGWVFFFFFFISPSGCLASLPPTPGTLGLWGFPPLPPPPVSAFPGPFPGLTGFFQIFLHPPTSLQYRVCQLPQIRPIHCSLQRGLLRAL